jgi:nucleotide-binding universal stress UspA family protein
MSIPIIVGVALRDDDAAPIALGRDLALLTDTPLALVHAFPYEQPAAVPASDHVSGLHARSLAALEDLAAPLRAEVQVTVRAGTGPSPAAVLRDAAAALDASLIVVGSTHRGRLGRVVPGSVTARLLHDAAYAIAVAPRGHVGGSAIRRIGVAFVDTPEGRDALTVATVAAGLCGGTIRVFTVHQELPPEAALEVPAWGLHGAPETESLDRAVATAERARELVPADMLDDVEVITGHPADALITVSSELDLLVCGSRGFSPLHAALSDGVSRALVDGAPCPVLVLPHVADKAIARLVHRRAAVEG